MTVPTGAPASTTTLPVAALPATTPPAENALPALIPHEDPEPETETSFQEFLLERIQAGVKKFGESCDVSHAIVYATDDFPCGFWMDCVPLNPCTPKKSASPAERLQHMGWWTLVSLSGQLRREVIHLMPIDNKWRAIDTLDTRYTEDDRDNLVQIIGKPPDYLYFACDWMLYQFTEDIYETYMQLMLDMRKLVVLAPHRFRIHGVGMVEAHEAKASEESETESAKP